LPTDQLNTKIKNKEDTTDYLVAKNMLLTLKIAKQLKNLHYAHSSTNL
jgi:hypothetical protein